MALDDKPSKTKGKSDTDEKTAVASGAAVLVIIILLIAWGFFFIRKIQKGQQQVGFDATAQDEFNFSTVREAQKAIQQGTQNTPEELRAIRDSAATRQLPANMHGFDQENSDQFNVPGDSTY